MRWTRTTVAVVCLIGVVGCGAGVLPPIRSEAERLEVARRLMSNREWVQAIDLLKTYVSNNAGSADVDAALYWLGECYLKTKDHAAAELEFDRLLRDYPESDSSVAASFRLGEALYAQARGPDFDQEFTLKALQQWESFRRGFPGHWLIPAADRKIAEARSRLAVKLLKNGNLYLKLMLGEPARAYFERILVEYADTPQAGDATIGLALADVASHRKADAIDKLKRIEAEFPGQPIAARAAKERARLER